MPRLTTGRRMRRTIRRIGANRVRYVRKRLARRSGGRIRQPVQFFKRSVWKPLFITATGAAPHGNDVPWSYIPTLADVTNSSEFTALYDQYQIKGVKVEIIPKFTQMDGLTGSSPGVPASSMQLPNIASVLDYDGIGTFNTMDVLCEYQNLKMTRGNRVHKRYFKPAVQSAVYQGLASTGYNPKKNVWLDCNNASVPHYGLYGLVTVSDTDTNIRIDCDARITYYLAFKNVK